MIFGFSNEAISDNSPKGGFLHGKPVLEKLATRRVLPSCIQGSPKKRKNSKNLKSLFSWFLAVFFKFQFIERKPWGDPRSGGAGYKPGNFVHIERPVGRTPKGAIVGKVSCTRFWVFSLPRSGPRLS